MTTTRTDAEIEELSSPFVPGAWADDSPLPPFSPADGVTMRAVAGDRLMMTFVRIAPGAEVPLHAHDNEQMGTILEGTLILTIGEETRELGFGDAYQISPNVLHRGVAGDDGCLVLDAFSPPRTDYAARSRSGG